VRCRGFHERNVKLRYKRYCKILTDVIKTDKIRYYDQMISKPKNKTKNMENYKKGIGDKNCQNDIHYLKINNTITNINREFPTLLMVIS
jgi:hypothetical protein